MDSVKEVERQLRELGWRKYRSRWYPTKKADRILQRDFPNGLLFAEACSVEGISFRR